MNEFIQCGELKAQAKRLLRYRLPLALAIAVNCFLIARVPMSEMRGDTTPIAAASLGGSPSAAMPHRGEVAVSPARPTETTPDRPGSVSSVNASPDLANSQVDPIHRGRDLGLPREPRETDWSDAGASARHAASGLARLAHEVTARLRDSIDIGPFEEHRNDLEAQARSGRVTPPVIQGPGRPALDNSAATSAGDDSLTPSGSEHSMVVSPPPPPAASVALHSPGSTSEPDQLTIRNPAANNGPVRFLLNGRTCELYPGEAHVFPAAPQWIAQFHRGGSFGNVRLSLTAGSYDFEVTSTGWELKLQTESPVADPVGE